MSELPTRVQQPGLPPALPTWRTHSLARSWVLHSSAQTVLEWFEVFPPLAPMVLFVVLVVLVVVVLWRLGGWGVGGVRNRIPDWEWKRLGVGKVSQPLVDPLPTYFNFMLCIFSNKCKSRGNGIMIFPSPHRLASTICPSWPILFQLTLSHHPL